jgi:hypothetical protein
MARLYDGAHKSAQLATLVSLSVLIPSGPACGALLGQLGKDDLVHHGDIAFAAMAAANVQKL